MKTTTILLTMIIGLSAFKGGDDKLKKAPVPPSIVDFDAFAKLTNEVKEYRTNRLVNLDEFLKMSKETGTVILDTRSDALYKAKHIKGAIHLDFTDFTQANLAKVIPSTATRILIYCNNNFEGDQQNFATKSVQPMKMKTAVIGEHKPLSLALNIPTFINLYGYGYKNIYELGELVTIGGPFAGVDLQSRVKFEGTSVAK